MPEVGCLKSLDFKNDDPLPSLDSPRSLPLVKMLGLYMELRHMILRFCDYVDLCHLSICSKGGVELVKSFCYFKGGED